jgi:hypothetical protein
MNLKNIYYGLGLLTIGAMMGYNAHNIDINKSQERTYKPQEIEEKVKLPEESQNLDLKNYDVYCPGYENLLSVALRTSIMGTDKVPYFTLENIIGIRIGIPMNQIKYNPKENERSISEPRTELEEIVNMMKKLNLQNPNGIINGHLLDKIYQEILPIAPYLVHMIGSSPNLSESERAIALLSVSKTVDQSKLNYLPDPIKNNRQYFNSVRIGDKYLEGVSSAFQEFVTIPFVSEGRENLKQAIQILDYMQDRITVYQSDEPVKHLFYIRKLREIVSDAQSEDPNNIIEYAKRKIDELPFSPRDGVKWKPKERKIVNYGFIN